MKYFKASTKRGQQILSMSDRCIYSSLGDIYTTWSTAKARAFEWCREQFEQTENHIAFGVGSGNSFGFTASWLGTLNGEQIARVETKDNSYIVWLER